MSDTTYTIVNINKKQRTATIRYKDVDVKAIFHRDGEMDWENYESLTEGEFNDLTMWVIENEELEKIFPCPYWLTLPVPLRAPTIYIQWET